MWCRFAGQLSWTLLPAREERWRVAAEDTAHAYLQRTTEWATAYQRVHGQGSCVRSLGSNFIFMGASRNCGKCQHEPDNRSPFVTSDIKASAHQPSSAEAVNRRLHRKAKAEKAELSLGRQSKTQKTQQRAQQRTASLQDHSLKPPWSKEDAASIAPTAAQPLLATACNIDMRPGQAGRR